MPHQPFHYRTLEELEREIAELGLALPVSRDLAPLRQSVKIGDLATPNAIAIQPMEGCDGTRDGRPGELTRRRYLRFAAGGAGLLWFEATAVVPEARANPHQLLISRETAPSLARLRQEALTEAQNLYGKAFRPFTVLQLTHSGRYSRPVDQPAPIIAHHDGLLDKVMGLPEDYPLISDADLDRLQDAYVAAARLALECGFDAIDVKSCHRYLISELLAAHTRPGKYGGSFENRTRFLREVVQRVREEVPEVRVTVRLNVYDGHPYPWGWGVDRQDPRRPDLTEPLRLIGLLREAGVLLINVTAGNPYYTPHINRPFDQNVVGGYTPDEHPLIGVMRLLDLTRQVKEAYPDMVVVGSGYTWLRQFSGNVAAGVLAAGWADMAGWGRGAFAYPEFARDLIQKGALDPDRVCITCSRCTQLMRDHGPTGCVVFDREVYGPIYREKRRLARQGEKA